MESKSDVQTSPQAAAEPSFIGPNTRVPSYSGAGLVIKGQIIGDEDLKIDGTVEGPISLGNHRLTVWSDCPYGRRHHSPRNSDLR